MEKKSKMWNVDELCVKYVFDELDPSEIILVEQAIAEDQNLLIEVESLKSTWHKLSYIPEFDPPENISEAIIDQARDYSKQQQLFGGRWYNPGLMATTTLVILSLLISSAYVLQHKNESGDDSADSRIAGSAAPASAPEMEANVESETFAPWIDRRNMMYLGTFEDQDQDRVSRPDTLQSHGIRYKYPAGESLIINPSIHDFQLTGTQY